MFLRPLFLDRPRVVCAGLGHHCRNRSHRTDNVITHRSLHRTTTMFVVGGREKSHACTDSVQRKPHQKMDNKGMLAGTCRKELLRIRRALKLPFWVMALRQFVLRDAVVLRCLHRMDPSEDSAERWNDVSVQLLSSAASNKTARPQGPATTGGIEHASCPTSLHVKFLATHQIPSYSTCRTGAPR